MHYIFKMYEGVAVYLHAMLIPVLYDARYISFIQRPIYSRGSSTRQPMDMRLDGSLGVSGYSGIENNVLTGNQTLFIQPTVQSIYLTISSHYYNCWGTR
jgi:hypothetical protein